MFAFRQTCEYFNIVSNNSQQENDQKRIFFGQPKPVEGTAVERIELMILY